MWTVIKFGGSSQTKDGLNKINIRTNELLKKESKVLIVVSAVQSTTNNIVKCIEEKNIDIFSSISDVHLNLCSELDINDEAINIKLNELRDILELIIDSSKINIRIKAKAISYGEQLSSMIVKTFLHNKCEIPIKLIDSKELIYTDSFLESDSYYLNAEYKCNKKKFFEYIKHEPYNVFITQGFVARTNNYDTCLLSRGGSDTSASLLASMLDANSLEIWTDVNGIYSGDPRIVENTKLLKSLDYGTALQMATMGAKVLHPYCIKPCEYKQIPISIFNTYSEHNSVTHTIIKNVGEYSGFIGVSKQTNTTVFTIDMVSMWRNYGVAAEILGIFRDCSVDIGIINDDTYTIMIGTNEINKIKLDKVSQQLKHKFKINVENSFSTVSVISSDKSIYDSTSRDYLSKFLMITEDYHIRHIHYGANRKSVSFVLPDYQSNRFMNELHSIIINPL